MFKYIKTKLLDITKEEPLEKYSEALVIGELASVSEDEKIENYYFLIEDVIINDGDEEVKYSGYMKAAFPERILTYSYLYLVQSSLKDFKLFFIDPSVYEATDEEHLDELLLDAIMYDKIIEDEEEFLEKVRMVKEEYDSIQNNYLGNSFFYELTDESKHLHGSLYLTQNLLPEFVTNIDNLDKELSYKIHYQPIIFKLNSKELIFAGEDTLKYGVVRLLEINEWEELVETARFHIDDAIDFMEEENRPVVDLVTTNKIAKDLIDILQFTF